MSLGLFNCRLIQLGGDQLFFFATGTPFATASLRFRAKQRPVPPVFRTPRIHLTLESTPDCILGMGAKMASHAARIGQVAQETGISIDTIRFYEKQGLLKRSPRTEGGFRLFGLSDIETLRFVRKAQELGFSLNEIRELLIL